MSLVEEMEGAKIVVERCANAEAGEHVLIVGDWRSEETARRLAAAVELIDAEASVALMRPREHDGNEPPDPVAAAMQTHSPRRSDRSNNDVGTPPRIPTAVPAHQTHGHSHYYSQRQAHHSLPHEQPQPDVTGAPPRAPPLCHDGYAPHHGTPSQPASPPTPETATTLLIRRTRITVITRSIEIGWDLRRPNRRRHWS